MTPMPETPAAGIQGKLKVETIKSEAKTVAGTGQAQNVQEPPADLLDVGPLDYIDYKKGLVAAEAFQATQKKKGTSPPKAAKATSKETAFPFKKRREYNRIMENIADGLFFSDKLRKEKERSMEQKEMGAAAGRSGIGQESDKEWKPVYTYKTIPKGGLKVKKETQKMR